MRLQIIWSFGLRSTISLQDQIYVLEKCFRVLANVGLIGRREKTGKQSINTFKRTFTQENVAQEQKLFHLCSLRTGSNGSRFHVNNLHFNILRQRIPFHSFFLSPLSRNYRFRVGVVSTIGPGNCNRRSVG